MKTVRIIILAAVASVSAAGCAYNENEQLTLAEGQDGISATTFGSGPEQVWVEKAKENFKHGEYGLAERYFRQAVEERRSNPEAWLGLAASYDHLKKFEDADRAYAVLQKMVGTTPAVLNNLGYHYMLKGEFASAENALQSAQAQDPYNPSIRANLALLADWKAAAANRS